MPSKEMRKVVKVGVTSLGVIIPKHWLDFHNIKHGDRVEVITNGNVHIKPIKEE